MSRSVESVKSEIEDLAPSWLFGETDAGDALAEALAEVLVEAEEAFDALAELLHRQTSSGEHLEDLAVDRGVEPLPWEGDAELCEIATVHPQSPTPDVVNFELNRRLRREGWSVDLAEPHFRVTLPHDGARGYEDAGIYTDVDRAQSITVPREYTRLIVVQVPVPEVVQYSEGGCFTGNLSTNVYAGPECFTGPSHAFQDRRDEWLRVEGWLEHSHPHGCAVALQFRDTAELAHFDALLTPTGGIT